VKLNHRITNLFLATIDLPFLFRGKIKHGISVRLIKAKFILKPDTQNLQINTRQNNVWPTTILSKSS